jgi:hypothetical protein
MAAQDGLTFEGTFNSVTVGLFKDNTTNDIEEVDSRALVTAIRESYLNRIDDLPIAFNTVATGGGTLTFDCSGANWAILALPTSFATPKTVALSNDTRARKIDFSFQITNVAAIITFPASFIMSDVRWEEDNPQEWKPVEVGKYTGTALYDGTNWFLTISPSVFV